MAVVKAFDELCRAEHEFLELSKDYLMRQFILSQKDGVNGNFFPVDLIS
jgi:hypothetical protein